MVKAEANICLIARDYLLSQVSVKYQKKLKLKVKE